MSGSPYRLFKVKDLNIDLSELENGNLDEIDQQRIEIIRTIFGCKSK